MNLRLTAIKIKDETGEPRKSCYDRHGGHLFFEFGSPAAMPAQRCHGAGGLFIQVNFSYLHEQ